MNATLAAAGAVHLAVAGAFAAVGQRFRQRHVAPENQLARTAFVTWWWAFALYLLGEGALDVAAALGWTSLGAHLGFRLLSGPLLAVAAWGLAFHMLFLWSGRHGLAFPLAAYYAVAGALYSLIVSSNGPDGVTVGQWASEVSYERPPAGPLWTVVLASFGLPLVAGSLAYLGLVRRATEREQRFRIVLVSVSLLVWVTAGFAAEVGGGPLVQFVAIVLVGLATAAAVLVAYYPPAPIARWLHAPR